VFDHDCKIINIGDEVIFLLANLVTAPIRGEKKERRREKKEENEKKKEAREEKRRKRVKEKKRTGIHGQSESYAEQFPVSVNIVVRRVVTEIAYRFSFSLENVEVVVECRYLVDEVLEEWSSGVWVWNAHGVLCIDDEKQTLSSPIG
jgi:hypothetical protein